MEEFLKQLMGKEIDVASGNGTAVRGNLVDVKDGILYMRDEEEKVAYVVIEKITCIWEVAEEEPKAGFLH